jgi:hypothetical protein
MIDLKLIQQYNDAVRWLREQQALPSVAPPPPTRSEPKPDLFTPSLLANLMATKFLASRLLSLFAAQQADPGEWLRAERALLDQVIASTSGDAAEILAMTREHFDVLFSDATALLQK